VQGRQSPLKDYIEQASEAYYCRRGLETPQKKEDVDIKELDLSRTSHLISSSKPFYDQFILEKRQSQRSKPMSLGNKLPATPEKTLIPFEKSLPKPLFITD